MQLADSEPAGFFLNWLGEWHYHLLHFPIALVIMTVIAEAVCYFKRDPMYCLSARFMLWAAAIAFIPTVLSGYLLSKKFVFAGTPLEETFWWHAFWGIFSLILCWFALLLREWGRRANLYYLALLLLLVSVCIAGSLGGRMAFGI